MNCPDCGKTVDTSAGYPLFCPWCGHKLALSEDAGLNKLLTKAQAEEDYAKKREILLEAKRLYPDEIEVEKQLLYIGRLYEKGGKPDFYRIPFWPLNALEKPGEFSRRDRSKMLDSFLNNPELKRVAALSGDGEAFYKEYYTAMMIRYIDLFIKGATSNNSLFFFRRSEKNRVGRYTNCVRFMLNNLEASVDVPQETKAVLRQAILDAYRISFGAELDA